MVKNTKNFMMKLLNPNSGVSSKRFIALFGTFFLCIVAILNQVFNLTISDTIIGTLGTIVLGALGSTAMEKFGKTNNEVSPNIEPPAQNT